MELYTRPRKLAEVPVGALLMLPLFGLPFGGWLIEQGHVSFGLCSMKAKFDLPCLSCGATRGTLRLFHGDPLGAIAYQPMMMLIYTALLVWGFISLWGFAFNKRVVVHMSDHEDMAIKLFIIGVPIANWIYLYKMGI